MVLNDNDNVYKGNLCFCNIVVIVDMELVYILNG